MWKKFMDWFMEKFLSVVIVIMIIFVIGLIGALCCIVVNENKQDSEAKAVFYCYDKCYYIDSYLIKDDEIIAIDVQGESMTFPKDRTVIKNKRK